MYVAWILAKTKNQDQHDALNLKSRYELIRHKFINSRNKKTWPVIWAFPDADWIHIFIHATELSKNKP